ncbi:MAG: tetratricopeptide repeat protein [Acidobacteria bacterium]|nr:tetratricopeptide repeat protein [Acidobacteriota bacterium]MBI3425952.1 tetratricopeptide repeat protein [Acidobacteriota bacterium]
MISIPIRFMALRLALLLVLTVALGWLGWSITRAAIGDSLSSYAERTPNLSNEARLRSADAAAKYAPQDPLVRWNRGGLYLAAAADEQAEQFLPTAVAELRAATQASPNDYRLWLTYGRALERNGTLAEARAAFKRAVELAPNHFDSQWGLGNYLLRADERAAAFDALRQALRQRPAAMPLIFDYAWNVYDGDSRAIAEALAETNETRAQLAALLSTRHRVDDALQLWRESNPHTPAETRQLAIALTNAGHFKAAYDLWRATKDDALPPLDSNSMLANGSFEQNFDPASTLPLLSWRCQPGQTVNVSLDQQTHAVGQMSLRFRFEQEENLTLILATQTAPVQPNTSYCLSFAARTEALQSLSTPLVSVTDAVEEKRLGVSSAPLPNGTRDWQPTTLRFTTKPATEAVTVRVQRLPCAEPPCPLTGRLWLDDFKLAECAK